MTKDIEWLKEEIGELPCVDTVFISDGLSYMDSAVPVLPVYDLINQLDEPEVLSQELPVIPNYIADFLNERKDWALFEIFDDVYLHNEHPRVNEWLYGDGIEVPQGREIKMVMALKFGYKLEPEQKYYIRDQHGVYLLAKNHREQGKVQTVAEIVEYYGVEEVELDYELTEQEIKDYDERFWPFAVKVEELEE